MATFKLSQARFAISAGLTIAALASFSPAARADSFSLDFDTSADGGSLLKNADGTLDTTQWSDWGLSDITGVSNRQENGQKQTAKFNTYYTDYAGTSGIDDDLRTGANWGTESQGNVLLIQEQDKANRNYFQANGQYRADDEWMGGTVQFNFAEEVKINSFMMLDIDDDGSKAHDNKGKIEIKGTDSAGGQAVNINVAQLIDKLVLTYGSNASDAYNQSVTIDGVTMTQKSSVRGDNSMFEFMLADTYVSELEFVYPGSGAIAGLDWTTQAPDVPRAVPEPTGIASLLLLGLGASKLRRRKSEH